jgi:hypothetical protein
MSSIQNAKSSMAKWIHRKYHEIEERVDISADLVSEIIDAWAGDEFDALCTLKETHGDKVDQVIILWERAKNRELKRTAIDRKQA